jgi:hypothetical protein
MFLKRFRQTGPDIVIMIFIISMLLWAGSFLHPHELAAQVSPDRPMPLYYILEKLTYLGPFVSVLSAYFLVMLISFLLVNLNTSDLFIGERTFLPGLFYILISGIFISQQTLNPVLPAAIFLIMASRRIMDSYKIMGVAYSFFDAGLLIGLGSLFYFNFIWFGFLLIIGIAILRTGNPKEIIISILGLATPLFLIYGFLFITGKDLGSLMSDARYNLFGEADHHIFSTIEIAAIIVTGVVLLISLFKLLPSLSGKKIKSRKTFNLLIWTLLLSVILYFVSHSASVELIWIAGVPVSYIISHFFVYARRRFIPEIMFVSLFLVVALVQIFNLI